MGITIQMVRAAEKAIEEWEWQENLRSTWERFSERQSGRQCHSVVVPSRGETLTALRRRAAAAQLELLRGAKGGEAFVRAVLGERAVREHAEQSEFARQHRVRGERLNAVQIQQLAEHEHAGGGRGLVHQVGRGFAGRGPAALHQVLQPRLLHGAARGCEMTAPSLADLASKSWKPTTTSSTSHLP